MFLTIHTKLHNFLDYINVYLQAPDVDFGTVLFARGEQLWSSILRGPAVCFHQLVTAKGVTQTKICQEYKQGYSQSGIAISSTTSNSCDTSIMLAVNFVTSLLELRPLDHTEYQYIYLFFTLFGKS